MTEQRFDVFTRQTAEAISRRQSLLALGGAALAAGLTAPAMTEAKKNPARKPKKNLAKKAKKKFERACSQSKEQCRVILASLNEEDLIPCCDRCLTSEFVACLFENGV